VGRHQLVTKRRQPPALLVGVVAALAVLAATGGSESPVAVQETVTPVVEKVSQPCCLEVVAASPAGYASPRAASALISSATPAQLAASSTASRWRVIDGALPVGVAPERGLQIDTIFLARSISARFPQIHDIGGWRPDALRWHPEGLALDVMIPNPSSPAGIALGNDIVVWALENAARFNLQDAIWRGEYYTPSGPQYSGMAHFDHVHLTTYGGGYPTGSEIYYR
jgi:hypothetical protein